MAVIVVLALAGLGCASAGARDVARSGMIARLPTLTRTPLPTLTATAVLASVTETPPLTAVETSAASQAIPVQNETVALNAEVAHSVPEAAQPAAPAATHDPLPTGPPSATPTPPATASPVPTNTATPLPTATVPPTATATPTPTPTPSDWIFTGVKIYPDPQQGGLLLYGTLVNKTGTPQELRAISGTFFNAEGQVIASPSDTFSYWPGHVIPHDGTIPFELAVDIINSAANFKLAAEAQASGDTPRQDFDWSAIEQWTDDSDYCVSGELRNRGGKLDDYLVIALAVYDAHDNVISFTDYEEYDPDWVVDDKPLDYQLCVNPFQQAVVRHEVLAWGR